jgi:purine-binding chemotaxis protein CheW
MHDRESSLLCRVGGVLCAVPLHHVAETMRPLEVEPIAGVPSFVRGLAVIRGVPTPVVDAASLVGGGASRATRFVTVRTGTRCVALAVESVVGIAQIPAASLAALPQLLEDAADVVAAVGTLDSELLLVLRASRLVPDRVWATIQADGALA